MHGSQARGGRQDRNEIQPIPEPYQPAALTGRGAAYLRLSEFQDVWAGLAPTDQAWFAEDLRDLLVEAVVPGVEQNR